MALTDPCLKRAAAQCLRPYPSPVSSPPPGICFVDYIVPVLPSDLEPAKQGGGGAHGGNPEL